MSYRRPRSVDDDILPTWGGMCQPPPPRPAAPQPPGPATGPAKVHIITLMVGSTVYRQCSHCRQVNVYVATETAGVNCKRCGHRADVNKRDCDCSRCRPPVNDNRTWIDDAERGIRRGANQ